MDTYYARLCFNTLGWQKPSGEAKKYETGTFVTKHGYGYEEWLFRNNWQINGDRYGFLQPINRTRLKPGAIIKVNLYVIHQGKRYFVGEIRECHILTEVESLDALKLYKENGWIKTMEEQIQEVKENDEHLEEQLKMDNAKEILNIRFRESDAHLYKAPKADDEGKLKKRDRYLLYKI